MSLLMGTELNSVLLAFFEKRVNAIIIASLDEDLTPHTAPFNYIIATDTKHLRVAISKLQQTYENIINNVCVDLVVFDEGDLAVSIKGSARVIKESMETDCNMGIIEIEVTEVRKNNSPDFFVTQGIRIWHKSEPSLYFSRRIFSELCKPSNG